MVRFIQIGRDACFGGLFVSSVKKNTLPLLPHFTYRIFSAMSGLTVGLIWSKRLICYRESLVFHDIVGIRHLQSCRPAAAAFGRFVFSELVGVMRPQHGYCRILLFAEINTTLHLRIFR